MIRGIGLELVQVAPYDRFLAGETGDVDPNWFSEGELAYCRGRGSGGEHLAARYAAKVATLKALHIADLALVSEVTVERETSGRPHLELRPEGFVAQIATDARLHLSMSHSGGFAVAMVVVEAGEDARQEVEHNESV